MKKHTRCLFTVFWIHCQLTSIESSAFVLKNSLSLITHVQDTLGKQGFQHKKNVCNPLNVGRGGDAGSESNKLSNNLLNGPKAIGDEIRNQFEMRVAADPDFVQKSIVEIIFAISMQFMAEVSKRGIHRIAPEIDFVIAGIFTAMAGKYYSMWRVAKTVSSDPKNVHQEEVKSWRRNVPTNAFQDTLLDGKTKPDALQRIAAFFVPIPSLFQAGFIASAIGYGFTAILISLRSMMIPSYEAATVNVNIFHACLYTGSFMAIISNIRYQVLQGLIEPKIIDKLFGRMPAIQTTMISLVRLVNGLLGSYLAITGMKVLGLQKLK